MNTLNNKNYYSPKANQEYISVSQYKDFVGCLAYKGCEFKALAKLNGEYVEEPNTAMLIGSYIDSYFEGTLDDFKTENPAIFKKDGSLKSDFVQAEEIIKRIERDKKFMQFMGGDKQIIMTGEIGGAKWKIKMDSYIKDKAIVDLKIVRDIYETTYAKDIGKLNFIQARGYDFQLAIYQEVVFQNTGKRLPCYIAVADKGKVPNIEVIQLTQQDLDTTIAGVDIGVNRILKLKSGEVEPAKCNTCDWCKENKVITRPILMSELNGEL